MQKITNIEIKNFKSIRHAEIKDCRKVNVFIGYPNVGKSNILEALGLYSILQLSKGDYFTFNDICRIKSPTDIFFNKNYREKISIILNDEVALDAYVPYFDNSKLKLDIFSNYKEPKSFVFEKDENRDITVSSDFSIEFEKLRYLPDSRYPIQPIKKYEFRNSNKFSNNQNFSLSLPFGFNLLDILQQEKSLRIELSDILKDYKLKLLLDNESKEIFLIKELDESVVSKIGYHLIADTLKRLFFYKSAIQSNHNSVLLFEEPEAHMFPPYVAKFTSDIIFDKNDNQYFIATHSPFVLNDFMEDMDKEDLSIYAVGLKDGETVIKRMTDEEITEVYQYGVDLFFNLEDYLKDAVS